MHSRLRRFCYPPTIVKVDWRQMPPDFPGHSITRIGLGCNLVDFALPRQYKLPYCEHADCRQPFGPQRRRCYLLTQSTSDPSLLTMCDSYSCYACFDNHFVTGCPNCSRRVLAIMVFTHGSSPENDPTTLHVDADCSECSNSSLLFIDSMRHDIVLRIAVDVWPKSVNPRHRCWPRERNLSILGQLTCCCHPQHHDTTDDNVGSVNIYLASVPHKI